jgi:predicted N-acetyltransferase YhbS
MHGDAQRLRQVRFLRIDAGQDIDFQVVDFEDQTVRAHGLGKLSSTQGVLAPKGAAPLTKDNALVEIIPLADLDPARVEALLDAAFGPDRFSRTAYACRAGTIAIAPLSFAALDGDVLIGTIQCWPVALFDADGRPIQPLIMVGPVAAAPDRQRGGIGRRLMDECLGVADHCADGALMMIGDPEYYGRFFGFSAEATAGWALPGPFEPRRLLALGANGHSPAMRSGMIGPYPR